MHERNSKEGQYARSIKTIYLAGGMKTGWQDVVKTLLPGNIYLDPRDHGFTNEAEYTAWDLTAVRQSDIVFGYMEKSNPNGAGLALEFGLAHGLGIELHYIEDAGFPFTRAFGMVRAIADYKSNDLEEALYHLAKQCKLQMPDEQKVRNTLVQYEARCQALSGAK